MKIISILIVFIFALVFTCCKKEVPVAVKVKEKPNVTQRKFASYLVSRLDVKNIQRGDSLVLPVNRDKIITSEKFAIARSLKDSCGFYYLESKLRYIQLTVVCVIDPKGGSDLEVENYYDLVTNHDSSEIFYIKEPTPTEIEMGDSMYWIGSEGQSWGTR